METPARRSLLRTPLGIVLALGFGLLGLLAAGELRERRVPRAPGEELQELFVRDVVETDAERGDVVLLQAVGGSLVLPVVVSSEEADTIRAARRGADPGGRLLEEAVSGLGGEIRAVLLVRRADALGGVVLVERRGDALPIDAPVAAAIAAALSAGEPILATPGAIEQGAIEADADEPRDPPPGGDAPALGL